MVTVSQAAERYGSGVGAHRRPPDSCVERIGEYQRCGIGQFLFTIPHLANSEYLDVVGHEIIAGIKSG